MAHQARHQPAFAVVRLNVDALARWSSDPESFDPEWAVSVLHVHRDKATADREAERLNLLNSEKSVKYFSQHTRIKMSLCGDRADRDPEATDVD